jgi:predicted RNA methylase
MNYTATYSPEDNKLRLYASARLDPETYARVKAAGFSWAPKQELFVAPMWTPERADLLVELAGEIGDEDKSLVERAEERAERFEDYSEARAKDAEQARAGVARIADGIPLGQPILVGHHSERHARKDAERIENGMRRTVKMWEQAQYWKDRARGAVGAAKYKELPAVRARRIKGIEADKRKRERFISEAQECLRLWEKVGALPESEQMAAAIHLAGHHQAGRLGLAKKEGDREDWGHKCDAYSGLTGQHPTLYAQRTVEEVLRAARSAYPRAIAHSQRWLDHYENRLAYEKAMLEADGGTEADKTKPEKGGACRCWASPRGGWSIIQKVNRVSVTLLDNWGNGGGDFTRVIPFDKLREVMSAAQVQEAREAGRVVGETKRGFGLTLATAPEPTPAPVRESVPEDIQAMKESLRAGVQVVVARCLFPTPPELARRVVELAEIRAGDRVLEPSAGTGSLVNAVRETEIGKSAEAGELVAVEINNRLVEAMKQRRNIEMGRDFSVLQADFLTCNGDLGQFDRIVMNPPFDHGSDIKHVQHALGMLNPNGRLVSIVAAGPRQREAFKDADEWIDLPEGSFPGTGVQTAIVIYGKASR